MITRPLAHITKKSPLSRTTIPRHYFFQNKKTTFQFNKLLIFGVAAVTTGTVILNNLAVAKAEDKTWHNKIWPEKWELAARLSADSDAPKDVLKAVFDGAIEVLENRLNMKLEPSVKQRVWNTVSKEKLKILEEILISNVCEKLLCSFKHKQIIKMLERHKIDNTVKNDYANNDYSATVLQNAYQLNKESIVDALVEKSLLMAKDLIPEIAAELRNEGIELPDPDKTTRSASYHGSSLTSARSRG